MGSQDRQVLGRKGEQAAERYLKKQGYRILHRNWKSALGELDLIAREGERLCFVEVKARDEKEEFGDGLEAVGPAKQAQIVRAALGFLMNRKVAVQDCRFDVVSVRMRQKGEPECELVQDAFPASSFYKY